MLAVASIFGPPAPPSGVRHQWCRLCVYLMSMQGMGKRGSTSGAVPQGLLDMGFHMFGYSDNGWGLGAVADKSYFPRATRSPETYRLLLPEIVMDPPVSWIERASVAFHRAAVPPLHLSGPGPNGALSR